MFVANGPQLDKMFKMVLILIEGLKWSCVQV